MLKNYFIPAPVPRSAGAQRLAKLKFESGASESESLLMFSRSIGVGKWSPTSSSMRQETDRCPHADNRKRAGKSFLDCGSGGGNAEDEVVCYELPLMNSWMPNQTSMKRNRILTVSTRN